MKRNIITFLLLAFCALGYASAAQNKDVTRVYAVFKTHLDVGFTDLSSVVEKRYLTEFIPKALEVGEKLRADGSGERYVWTTGSWLIWNYLNSASDADVKRLEDAISRGDIVWNAVPYTVETETMTEDLLETNLRVARLLDKKYGKKTIAAKMTDVPGHTRSIIAPLARNGVKFLHIGVNPACPIPAVPSFCRWRDPDGNEIMLVYQQNYGTEDILPDGKTVISVNFTGDNHGPHSYEAVKNIYAGLRQRYPNAEIIAASFNEIAEALGKHKDTLPVVTSEIGDTWIYGYGSSPIRMAKFRTLSRLYSKWLREGKIKRESTESIAFALELGLIAEHTQGMDIKTHLANWDKYDTDKFLAARSSAPFRKVEQSWKEIDDYLYKAIYCLPTALRAEAADSLAAIDRIKSPAVAKSKKVSADSDWNISLLTDNLLKVAGVRYRMFDSKDYDSYLDRYLRARYGWALDDLGKTGLDKSGAVSANIGAREVSRSVTKEKNGTRTVSELQFPATDSVDSRVYPEKIIVNTFAHKNGRKADIELTVVNKPAVRLPEAYWLSFSADGINGIVAEKTGRRVDILDVVEKGNRRMHGIDRYVDMMTSHGTIRIWSKDAFLVNIGSADGLDYSTSMPDTAGGIHFNLSNNLWDTNFSMWNEGSLTYRFTVELI
ncbi:MAG TPA: DUF5054 domain-containing protein [Porphyromonadaceae bacterium]|nr:DUF5054 domain-containing protein [Paramuribaculum sp.]HAB41684.1 DUF5054 domain-containing protein [Porphyromonadaceae bacterium]